MMNLELGDGMQFSYKCSSDSADVNSQLLQNICSGKNNPDYSGILFTTDTDTVAESKENTLCTNSNSKKKLMWHW